MLGVFYKTVSLVVRTNDKTIMFMAFHGRSYSDNPKAIYEYMKKSYPDYKYIWVLNNGYVLNEKSVRYGSFKFFYYLSKSKYWIFNCKTYPYMSKKKNQIYIQTWHGTPLKRLAHDIMLSSDKKFYRSGMTVKDMRASYDDDVRKYNFMISPNSFCTEIFQSAFHIQAERLIETGYPRNDFLTNITMSEKQKIKERLQLPLNKKIILYAPTWRDNSFKASGYTFELKADFYRWKEVLGQNYIVLFKPHYLITNTFANDDRLKDFLYFINAKEDINDLYVIADQLITDYSSVFFDYAILNRPIHFYMYDLEEYKNELRGFYLDIYNDLPGDVYEKEITLLEAVKNQKCDLERLHNFNKRFNYAQNGNCAKKVCDIVFREN